MPKGLRMRRHNGRHRNTYVLCTWFRDGDWRINGAEHCVAKIDGWPGYWIVPSWNHDESAHPDHGPFKTVTAAAVVATLMENT